jgi:S-adenosylmethionine hydrolase
MFISIALTLMSVGAWATPNGLVILHTDYGNDSLYVGILRGSIYSKFVDARIDTLTNSVPSFDIVAGAYLLAEACKEYPTGTTFCCVVDPGVGTPRKCIVLKTKRGQYFVAPDNGLLHEVAQRYGMEELREATNTALWREGINSSTFHGRDIFGPVSASLASGVPMKDVGPVLKKMVELDVPGTRVEDGVVHGTVVRSDPYGNLITNLSRSNLEQIGLKRGDRVKVQIGKQTYTAPLASTYSDVPEGERLVLIQSVGLVECAINQGSLKDVLGEGLHAEVTMRKP